MGRPLVALVCLDVGLSPPCFKQEVLNNNVDRVLRSLDNSNINESFVIVFLSAEVAL